MKVHLTSLGCAKNLVDSELMLGRFKHSGWIITAEPSEAETIIVNTCGFIESAIDESIDTILELARFKKQGTCRQLVVAGCLPERYREEIVAALPEVDLFLGTGAYDRIVEAVTGPAGENRSVWPDPNTLALQKHDELRIQSTPYLSYIKIAEGCSRHCTYCIIPKLRGSQRSRPLEDIVAEARSLIVSGAKELILVAQDTASYGRDLKPPTNFNTLLDSLAEVSDTVWFRFLYGSPDNIDASVIRTVARHLNICSYFDIPIQHVSSAVLKRMGRTYTQKDLQRLFADIRTRIPEVALRTTVMAGFPGETDREFKQLMDFIEEIQFDHLGVFIYSDAQDLSSHNLSGHVSRRVAQKRHDRLMSCQSKISLKNNRRHVDQTYVVIVEKKIEDNVYCGRTAFQAPEVDGLTYIHSKQLQLGVFYDVKIRDALEYDLIGETV